MHLEWLLLLGCLALLSFADLRYRVAPGAALFFLAAVLIAVPQDPLKVGAVILALGWGMKKGWPSYLALPLLLHPSTWGMVVLGNGVRIGTIGRFDLFTFGAVACLFDWPAPLLALAGVELWCRWWLWRGMGIVPALPGMFGGVAAYFLLKTLFQ